MEPSQSLAPRLARLQARTGLVIAVFVVMHLTTALAAHFGPEGYDGMQRLTRFVYQNPVSEIVLLTAIVVHVIASVRRMRLRTKREAPNLRVRLHRYAGYFLLLVIIGHVAATRLPALLYGIHVGFAALSYTMTRYPYYFYPYYALLALSGLYHMAHGVPVALGTLGVRVPQALRKGPTFVIPVSVLGVGLVLALLAIGGVFFPIHDPMDNDFARLGEALMK